MTATRQFIEDAIKAGAYQHIIKGKGFDVWESKKKCVWMVQPEGFWESAFAIDVHILLLSPFAWQMVGKTRNWSETTEDWWKTNYQDRKTVATNRFMMHRFIDLLCSGDTIDTALSKIE